MPAMNHAAHSALHSCPSCDTDLSTTGVLGTIMSRDHFNTTYFGPPASHGRMHIWLCGNRRDRKVYTRRHTNSIIPILVHCAECGYQLK